MSVFACLVTSLLAAVSGAAVDDESVTYFVEEELPVGSVIGNVLDDFALERRYHVSTLSDISFEFLTQPSGGYIRLENGSWNVVVAGRMDRETLCTNERRCLLHYTVAVRPLKLFQLLSVEVEVLDVNDHAPTFAGALRRHVMESAETGSQLAVATVEDRDVGVNGLDRYETTTDCAAFDPRPTMRRLPGGEVELRLRLERLLDREVQSRCALLVRAVDGGNPAKTGSTRVDVIIDDANDNAPTFNADSYEVWIPEDLPVGTCFIRVSASDMDEGLNAMVTYSLDVQDWNVIQHPSKAGLPFQIDAESGMICLKDKVDFESQSVFLLSLIVQDGGAESLSGRSTLTVYVEDVNDHAPTIVVEVISGSVTGVEIEENNEKRGLILALITVVDHDSGRNGRFVCSLNETSTFQLVEVYHGQYYITAISTLDREERDFYSVAIHCHDLGSPPLSSSSVIDIRLVGWLTLKGTLKPQSNGPLQQFGDWYTVR